MIKVVIFEDVVEKMNGNSFYNATEKFENFCKTNGIGKENIVSVSLSGADQYNIRSKILLVYDK